MFKIVLFMSNILKKIGKKNINISEKINSYSMRSKLIKRGEERNLYKTRFNDFFWLNNTGYIDKCIIQDGIFEKNSVAVLKKLVKNGDTVLDVGANIGFYSILFSKIVGNTGRILAFEPTLHYGKVLEKNLKTNNIQNCEIIRVGLSNIKQKLKIHIGPSSATIHVPGGGFSTSQEIINLISLDDYIKENNIDKIDFIKVDIDGHEPFFFKGALKTIQRYEPIILLEINQLNYFEAGFNAWDFYEMLKRLNFKIYSENNLKEFKTKENFLKECGNFAYSANILISNKDIIAKL